MLSLYGASSSSTSLEPSGVVAIDDSDGEATTAGASGAAGADKATKFVVREYLDKGKPCMMRCYNDGSCEESNMTPGPNGFGMSQFGADAPTETEVPNLVLVAKPGVMKKPAAAKGVMKNLLPPIKMLQMLPARSSTRLNSFWYVVLWLCRGLYRWFRLCWYVV